MSRCADASGGIGAVFEVDGVDAYPHHEGGVGRQDVGRSRVRDEHRSRARRDHRVARIAKSSSKPLRRDGEAPFVYCAMHRAQLAAAVGVVVVAAACRDIVRPPDSTIAALSIVAATTTLASLDTIRLTVDARDVANHRVSNPTVRWTTSNSAIADVNADGLVTAASFGHATVYARVGERTDSITLWVPKIGQPMLVGTRQPAIWYVAVGDSLLFYLVSRDLATDEPLTGLRLRWTSSDSTVVRVDAAGNGLAVGPGTAKVTARSGPLTGALDFTILAKAPAPTVFVSIEPVESVLAQRSVSLRGTVRGPGVLKQPVSVPVATFELYLDGVFRWRRTSIDTATDVLLTEAREDTLWQWTVVLRDTLSPGPHTLVARAYDLMGIATSGSVSFTIRVDSVNYRITPLARMPGVDAFPADINERGDVAGWVTGSDSSTRAVVWRAGGITVLPGSGTSSTKAVALNDGNDVVGLAAVSGSTCLTPLWWSSDTSNPTIPAAGCAGTGIGVNAHSAIFIDGPNTPANILYDHGSTTSLPLHPMSMNDARQVVGWKATESGPASISGPAATGFGITFDVPRAFPFADALIHSDSRAIRVNNRGDVLGVNHGRWFLTPSGAPAIDLVPALGGSKQLAVPVDLSDAGTVVAFDGATRAVYLWNAGHTSRVNVQPSGWRLEGVAAINAGGQIAARATELSTGQTWAVLLAPVP
jgi:hypothetical protein